MANHLDFHAPHRVSRQVAADLASSLVGQLRGHFYLGQLRRGDRLPSVRELARYLRVAPTTALSIYKKLEDGGIVASRERSGMFFESAGVERHRSTAQTALMQLLRGTGRNLKAQAVDVERFTRLLLWYSGRDIRTDFKFACCTCRESYELLVADLRAQVGFNLPVVHIPPDSGGDHSVRQALVSDRAIRSVLSTFMQSSRVFRLARSLELQVISLRLEPTISNFFAPTGEGRRYVVTRDRDCAESLRRVACSLFSPWQNGACHSALDEEGCARCGRQGERAPKHVCIAALDEPERLGEVDRQAAVVYAPMTAIKQVQARYGSAKTVALFPARLSQESADDILFHYVLADS